MGLRIRPKQFGAKIATFMAVFAIAVQPLYGLVASQVANAVALDSFPSTNQQNKDAGNPYVELVSSNYNTVALKYVNTKSTAVWFEYRVDAAAPGTGQYNPCRVGNVSLPSACNGKRYIAADDYSYASVQVAGNSNVVRTYNNVQNQVSVRSTFGPERNWDFDWINFGVAYGVCAYDFPAQKMWEVTWGYDFEHRNGGAPQFTMQSDGGLVSLNGGPVPNYMNSSWHWIYPTEGNEMHYVYGFANGASRTVDVTFNTVNGCQIPNIVWGYTPNTAPTLTVDTPGEGSVVSTKTNGNKLVINGLFEDNLKANYATLQLVHNGSSVAIGTLYGHGSVYNPNATYANADGSYVFNLPVDSTIVDGEYSLFYTGTDFTGGITTRMERKFFIDNTAPNVSWQLQPLAYYGNGNGFHVRPITSEVGTTKSVYIDSVAPGNLVHTLTSDHKNFDTTNSNNQALWDGLSEGTHKFVAVFTDRAGNTTTKDSNSFVVDHTAPVVKVNLNRTSYITSGDIVRSTANPEIEATDANLDRIEIWKNGSKVTQWTANSSSRRAGISWLGEGTYTVRVFDKAGNQASDFIVTIDNTAPVLSKIRINNETISGQYKHDTNCSPINQLFQVSGDLSLTAVIDDANGVTKASYKVRNMDDNGCTHTEIYSSNSIALTKSNKNASNWNQGTAFDTEELENGKYAVVLVTEDAAGNKTTKYIHLNVENTAPTNGGEDNGETNNGGNTGGNTGGQSTNTPGTQGDAQAQAFQLPLQQPGFTASQALANADVLGATDNGSAPTVKGASDQSKTLASTANPDVLGASDNKFFGLMWYWWLLIVAAVVAAGWWIIAAARRRRDGDDA